MDTKTAINIVPGNYKSQEKNERKKVISVCGSLMLIVVFVCSQNFLQISVGENKHSFISLLGLFEGIENPIWSINKGNVISLKPSANNRMGIKN